jgi:iron complex outermembrane receptor protein
VRGATLRWVPNDALNVNIAYDTSRDRDETSASVLLQAINPRGQPTTNYPEFIPSQRFVNYATFCVPELKYCIPPVSDSNDWGIASTIDYTFSPTVSVKSITGYRDYTSQFSTDASDGPLTAQLLYNQLAFRSFTQELRLNATFGRFDWTLGGFYYRGVVPRVAGTTWVTPDPSHRDGFQSGRPGALGKYGRIHARLVSPHGPTDF